MPSILCAVLLAVSTAAPVPKDAPKKLYFPTKKGTKWVYQTGDRESVQVISKVETKDGATLVTVGDEMLDDRLLVSVSEKGVAFVAGISVGKLKEPFWLLKMPIPEKGKWNVVLAAPARGTGTITASGPEKVVVPAGTFQAVRLDLDLLFLGERTKKSLWYAPGVGKVKQVEGDEIEVLKSFTPGTP